MKELHNLLEVSRDNESRLSDIIQTLRDRVKELEDHVGSYEAVSNRGEYTVTALQRELREASDKVMHLEGRLRYETLE